MLTILWMIAMTQENWKPAEENDRQSREVVGTLRLQVDNDLIAGTDQHYTSGWNLSWDTWAADRWEELLPPGLADIARRIPWMDGKLKRMTFSLSQILVTPSDIKVRELIEDDAPYAGALLLSLSMSSQDDDRMDVWQLTVGLVGPSAMGEETQKGIHQLVDGDEPRGWEHQLENEPVLNLHYLHKRRFLAVGNREGWSLDAGGAFQLAAGNLVTHAIAGLEIRGGWRMPSGFERDPDGLRMQFHGYARERDVPFGIHAFASFSARAWANTIFLDGNTFRDSHHVDKKPWMVVGGAGLSLSAGRWRLTLQSAVMSDPMKNAAGYDGFGTVEITHTF